MYERGFGYDLLKQQCMTDLRPVQPGSVGKGAGLGW